MNHKNTHWNEETIKRGILLVEKNVRKIQTKVIKLRNASVELKICSSRNCQAQKQDGTNLWVSSIIARGEGGG